MFFLQKNSRFANFCLFMTSVWLPAVSAYHFVVFNPITPVLQDMFNRTFMVSILERRAKKM